MADPTEVAVLSVKPGDVVLVRLPRSDFETSAWKIGGAVRAQIEAAGHHRTPVLCVSDDCQIEAVSEADVIAMLLEQARAK
jgi:hypothetical protein